MCFCLKRLSGTSYVCHRHKLGYRNSDSSDPFCVAWVWLYIVRLRNRRYWTIAFFFVELGGCLENVIVDIAKSWYVEILIPLRFVKSNGGYTFFVDVLVDFEKVCFCLKRLSGTSYVCHRHKLGYRNSDSSDPFASRGCVYILFGCVIVDIGQLCFSLWS